MSYTRGQVIARVQSVLGNTSTAFETYLEGSLDNVIQTFWSWEDWEFRHKLGTFNTIANTELYNLKTSITDLHSTQHIELIYDTTNKRFLHKTDLKAIKKSYPEENQIGQPRFYAPWGYKNVYLADIPDAIYAMKVLYLADPVLPTDDAHDLESVVGLPTYTHRVIDEWLLAYGYRYEDDNRERQQFEYVSEVLIPKLRQDEFRDLESSARFKFWQEELAPASMSYDDFLKTAFTYND